MGDGDGMSKDDTIPGIEDKLKHIRRFWRDFQKDQ